MSNVFGFDDTFVIRYVSDYSAGGRDQIYTDRAVADAKAAEMNQISGRKCYEVVTLGDYVGIVTDVARAGY